MHTVPVVVIHGLADARLALTPGVPVTLLSAPGAALYAGCRWWRGLVSAAAAHAPGLVASDWLDCADAPGRAMAALRIGQHTLILHPATPGLAAIQAIAAAQGGALLTARPAAFDMGAPKAAYRWPRWLAENASSRG